MEQRILCHSCTKPAVPGKSRCRQHLEELRLIASRYRARQKVRGLCNQCGQPAVMDKSRCERHLRQCGTSQRQRRNRINPQHQSKRRTKYNPGLFDLIVHHLWRKEPYLKKDWPAAEEFIRQHPELWIEPRDQTLHHAIPLDLNGTYRAVFHNSQGAGFTSVL